MDDFTRWTSNLKATLIWFHSIPPNLPWFSVAAGRFPALLVLSKTPATQMQEKLGKGQAAFHEGLLENRFR